MSERLLKWIIYIAGFGCLYIFIAIRVQPLFNAVLLEKTIPEYWENTEYGELYYFSMIKDFREKNLPHYIPKYRHTERHPKLQDADILTYGDSFFDFSRMETFPERLGDTLNQKVYYERFIDDHRPLVHLLKNHYSNNKPKIMIYESAERYIPFRFTEPHEFVVPKDERSTIRQNFAKIRDWIFLEDTEVKYTTLLKRSYLTTYLYSAVTTFKFKVFKYISSLTPKYALDKDRPWLFYHEQLNNENSSFYYQFTDEEIDLYCRNISDLAKKLKEKYDIEMIFMPIPSKYTIYHTLLNNDKYNNFLPRLYEGLKSYGVPVVELYDVYKNNKDVLYYGTDTHWNEKGLNIALNKALDVIDSVSNTEDFTNYANGSSQNQNKNSSNNLKNNKL